ncbi:MAG: outer membrane beta-barrel protein [Bacteroidetes bacterium]|nr:outer membrane beta-barrel protein [Bacteroidota bacterium]
MKKILIICFLLIASLAGFSQGSEIGPFIGGSYYMGELNPGKQFYNTQPAFGLIYRRPLNPRYAIKANFIVGNVEAYDSDSNNPAQVNRNLNFRSRIYDLSGQLEFNFLPFEIGDKTKPFSPYIFAGLAIFRFNPQAEVNGQWVDLKPLSTEGQGTRAAPGKSEYSLTQFAFPFGAGFKFAIAKRIGINIEWSLRRTWTDYLDDVSTTYPDLNILAREKGPFAASMSDRSLTNGDLGRNSGLQRGSSKRNDWYSFAGITFVYKIGPKIQKCPAYR